MRQFINIILESSEIDSENSEWLTAIEDKNWKEALFCCETQQQVIQTLQAMEARKVVWGNLDPIYVIGQDENDMQVIVWDGKDHYPEIEDVNRWIYDIDLSDYFLDYEEKFSAEFWENPVELYHATVKEKIADIEKNGLEPRNVTRGINNRGVGNAIFTTTEFETTIAGSYGDYVFQINTQQMKEDGFCPDVSQEPPVVKAEMRKQIAEHLGLEYWYDDVGSDMRDDTLIIYDPIPPQYLTLVE